MKKNFWKSRPLHALSKEEWEALCDGCGRCCLEKLEDEDTQEVLYTNVACKILDIKRCRCTHYSERHKYMPECLPITLKNRKVFSWLPSTCAYRLLYEGKELPAWHYLLCGKKSTVHEMGISVRSLAIPQFDGIDLEDYVIGEITI